jgi:hypothetical protein
MLFLGAWGMMIHRKNLQQNTSRDTFPLNRYKTTKNA